MTVKQIAVRAAELLQADEIIDCLSGITEDTRVTDPDSRTMLMCVSLSVAEAAADDPVYTSASVRAENKLIPISALPGKISGIKEVRRGGRRCAFTADSRGIIVPRDGIYTVTYTVPADTDAPCAELSVGAFTDMITLAYLTARNFCLVTGRPDEATIWDGRYAQESEKKRLCRRSSLPMRSWR